MPYAVIVAGTDFSAGGDAAVGEAAEIARRHGARLVVAYVVPPLVAPSPLVDDLMISQATMGVRENLRASGEREIKSRYQEKLAGLAVEPAVLDGEPAWELCELARRKGADLLAVGATGLSGLARVVFGSVASRVVRQAPCSVLIARARVASKAGA